MNKPQLHEVKERIAEMPNSRFVITPTDTGAGFTIDDLKTLAQSHSQLQEENEAMRRHLERITAHLAHRKSMSNTMLRTTMETIASETAAALVDKEKTD